MSDCDRKNKWIGACAFEPVFDKTPADFSQFAKLDRITVEFAETLRKVTFAGAICKRCGKIITKNDGEAQ